MAAATGRPVEEDHLRDLTPQLSKLTRQQLEILTLRYLVGLSTEQILQVMKTTAPALYSLESRIWARLARDAE